jgi:hypothetical protein
MEQPQMAVCDPDTQEGTPEGTDNLVAFIGKSHYKLYLL